MIVDPSPQDCSRPTILHVRTLELSDRKAPFIRQTILGLRPYFRNVVLTPSVEGEIPKDLHVEYAALRTIRNQNEHTRMIASLREKYPSISLVVGHMGNGAIAGSLVARSLGVPLLGIFGGSDINYEFHNPKYRAAYEELIRNPAAHFLTVADYLRTKLISYGGQADHLRTWHRGVDLGNVQLAQHAEVGSGQPIKAMVAASLREVKGHEFLVRALALLRQRNIEVETSVIGDGLLQGDLEALAHQLGVADLVKFHGRVSHAAVLEQLATIDLYVHPSITCSEGRIEGVPNAIMEAHAAGLPVVATDSGGIREVVLDGKTGFLVPERNPEALADRIAELAKDRALRVSMGARGRQHVEEHFSLLTQSDQLAAHITHTIQARHPIVSIVIPGCNCADTITACLGAIKRIINQPRSPICELLFIDDGSTDDSAKIAIAHGATVLSGGGKGAGAARNVGWRAAKSELIWFVDSDCVATETALESLLPHFVDGAVGAVGGAYDNGCPDSLVACMIHEEIAVRHRAMPVNVDFLASFNVMYRRSVLDKLDGFDERYLRGQDAELSFRALDAGHQLRFEHNSRVAHFHERKLSAYLRAQYRQGYWRAFLHMEHHGRVRGDSYSRLSDHLQPPIALLSLVSLPLLAFPVAGWLPIASLASLVALQTPMSRRLLGPAGPRIATCFAALSALRAYWRGIGLARGALAKILGPSRTKPT